MIPKIIHYSWISNDEYPPLIQKCMNSWEDKLKDYQFINWNTNTFDFSSSQFLSEAYAAKNYGFCSDYLRIYALYNYGGIWLDTDVEVVKSFDDFLHLPYFFSHEPFYGYLNYFDMQIEAAVMGSEKGNPIYSCALNWYNSRTYNSIKDDISSYTCPIILRDCIKYLYDKRKYVHLFNIDDFKLDKTYINIFVNTFFSPLYYNFDKSLLYDDSKDFTYAIHYFNGGWITEEFENQNKIKHEQI